MDRDDQATRDQVAIAEEALARKREIDAVGRPVNSEHAHPRHADTPRADQPPSGAFDAERHRPNLERTRRAR